MVALMHFQMFMIKFLWQHVAGAELKKMKIVLLRNVNEKFVFFKVISHQFKIYFNASYYFCIPIFSIIKLFFQSIVFLDKYNFLIHTIQ